MDTYKKFNTFSLTIPLKAYIVFKWILNDYDEWWSTVNLWRWRCSYITLRFKMHVKVHILPGMVSMVQWKERNQKRLRGGGCEEVWNQSVTNYYKSVMSTMQFMMFAVRFFTVCIYVSQTISAQVYCIACPPDQESKRC